MATYSIKPLLLAIVLAGVALPTQAMAGSATSPTTTSVEMWDVVAPRADVTPVVSHIDVAPSQGFDAPGTVVPMDVLIIKRAEFEGSVRTSEMWDAVSEDTSPKAVGVSHMDIRPGQTFDYPATSAPIAPVTVKSVSLSTRTTPDA